MQIQNHSAVVQNAESYKIEQDRDDGARGSNFLHHLSSKSITLHKTPVLGGFRDKEKRLVDYDHPDLTVNHHNRVTSCLRRLWVERVACEVKSRVLYLDD